MTVDKLSKALEVAGKFNIASLNQLLFFLRIADQSNPSKSILDLANTDDPTSSEYKRALGQFNKLAQGSKVRDRDGLELLRYIETGRNRRVGLTTKGQNLLSQLQEIGLEI